MGILLLKNLPVLDVTKLTVAHLDAAERLFKDTAHESFCRPLASFPPYRAHSCWNGAPARHSSEPAHPPGAVNDTTRTRWTSSSDVVGDALGDVSRRIVERRLMSVLVDPSGNQCACARSVIDALRCRR